jgi:anti-sigma B factor antagonist
MRPFGIETEGRGGAVVVSLTGDLDLSSADEAEQGIDKAVADKPELLVLDLSGLEFMDSSGLRVVVNAHRQAQEGGRRAVIVKGSPIVQRVFEITRLEERMSFVDSLDDVRYG